MNANMQYNLDQQEYLEKKYNMPLREIAKVHDNSILANRFVCIEDGELVTAAVAAYYITRYTVDQIKCYDHQKGSVI